jgi:selenocysteine lyase/cysteine desulfurase
MLSAPSSHRTPMTQLPPTSTDTASSLSGLTRRDVLVGAAAFLPLLTQAAELPVSTRELWGWVRAQQVLDTNLTYLDTATLGPGLRTAMVAEFRQQETFNSDVETYRRLNFSPTAVMALAQRLAKFAGCDPNEIVLTQGATEALNVIANGIELQAGDEVIVTQHAHGSALYPWLLYAARRGIVVKQVAFTSPLNDRAQALGLIASQVTDRTRVIAVSHVQYTDGAVLPVAEIAAFARQRNILTVVDGAQACGQVDLNLQDLGCDFYAGSLHKWMNAPYGMGFLFARRERIDTLWPLATNSNVGWSTINRYGAAASDDEEQRDRWPAAWRKFGWNTRHFGPRIKALEATLDFHSMLGGDRIEARIRELAIYARLRLQPMSNIQLLTPAEPGMWAGMLSFRPERGSVRELAERLTRNERIAVGAVEHAANGFAAVRLSLHIYNSHDDVERLLRALPKYL